MDEYETIVSQSRYTCLIEQVLEARPYVEQFCRLYGAKLQRILPTRENEKFEPLYVFDDNLGGYTLEGIINSEKFVAIDGGKE